MTTLRLIADDLTGALDTAAEFVGLTGPVQVLWDCVHADALPPNAALDVGTREATPEAARDATIAAAPALHKAGLAFKKIDSLIRGWTLLELASCLAAGPWDRAVLAPAFPFQARVTRGGQQFMRSAEGWVPVGPELVGALRALGVRAQHALAGQALSPGVTVFDAETDADLQAAVAAAGGMGAAVLWCGTGGLAQALSGGHLPAPMPTLPRPVLGLFGSDQAATAAQLAACGLHWTVLPDGGPRSAATVSAAIRHHGLALASLALPEGLARGDAARRIDQAFSALIRRLSPPGTLIAAGGETLRALCQALGASSLEVQTRLVPGVPVSILRGGAWDGVMVVSKSGAFGPPELLRDMLRIPVCERTAP